jgi:ABC-type transport system substrate-binding protein
VDPATASYVSSAVPHQVLYLEPLLELASDGSLKPSLAREWSYNSAGDELTIKLVDKAVFQDGTPVNAEAVKFSIDRAGQKEGRPAGMTLPTTIPTGTSVVDDRTVVVKLSKPSPDFLHFLTAAFPFCPVSPTAYKRPDDPWGFRQAILEKPVTAAPFKLTGWQRNQTLRFEKFDGYYKGAPYLDAVELRVVLEAAQRATLVRTGEMEISNNISPQDVASLEADKNLVVTRMDGSRSVTATFNGFGVFGPDNPKTQQWRQAMMMATDRDTIQKSILFGIGRVSDSPLLTFQDGYKSTKKWPYDPKKAQQILKDTGFDFNHTINLWFPAGGFTGDKAMTEAIQSMWQSIGLKVKLRQFNDLPTMYSTITNEGQNDSWDVDMVAWSMSPASADRIYGLFNKDGNVNKGGLTNYVDDSGMVDRLTTEILTTIDNNKRHELLAHLQGILMEELPHLFLFGQGYVWASSKKVKGLEVWSLETLDMRKAWLAA